MRGHIDCCVIRSMKRATLKMIQEWKKERNRRKKKKQKKKKNWKRRRIKEERRKRTMAARSADLLFCFVRFLFCWFRTGGWGGSFLFFSVSLSFSPSRFPYWSTSSAKMRTRCYLLSLFFFLFLLFLSCAERATRLAIGRTMEDPRWPFEPKSTLASIACHSKPTEQPLKPSETR